MIRNIPDPVKASLQREAGRREMTFSRYIRLVLAQKARELEREEKARQAGK